MANKSDHPDDTPVADPLSRSDPQNPSDSAVPHVNKGTRYSLYTDVNNERGDRVHRRVKPEDLQRIREEYAREHPDALPLIVVPED